MRTDAYGQIILTENDVCDLYMKDPDARMYRILVDQDVRVNTSILEKDWRLPKFVRYVNERIPIPKFDVKSQDEWFMPDSYRQFDIEDYVMKKCKNDAERERATEEMTLFKEREMIPILQYMKYLVDTMRKNHILWGVGRGSSTASFVLYLIGIHRIHSLNYGLQIKEFLK